MNAKLNMNGNFRIIDALPVAYNVYFIIDVCR